MLSLLTAEEVIAAIDPKKVEILQRYVIVCTALKASHGNKIVLVCAQVSFKKSNN